MKRDSYAWFDEEDIRLCDTCIYRIKEEGKQYCEYKDEFLKDLDHEDKYECEFHEENRELVRINREGEY